MRLEVSRRSDLALRLVRLIGSSSRAVSGRDAASALETSATFLAQVAAPLVAHGLVVSRPGPRGGYSAGPRLVSASVLTVIEAIEGATDETACVLVGGPCGAPPCALHDAWLDARAALRRALDARPAVDLSSG